MRAFGRLLLGARSPWLAVEPAGRAALADGWASFYTLSRDRARRFGSLWYALRPVRPGHPATCLNAVAAGLVRAAVPAGSRLLALVAPRRPRVGQLAFLVVAAFTITNKVYSPQYVLWLVALFPLARPRWRDFLIWQGAEIVYFVAMWWHLQGSRTRTRCRCPSGRTPARRSCASGCSAVRLRDDRPGHPATRAQDPIRAHGSDDPAGGVLDGAPDRFRLFGRRGELVDDDAVEGRGGHPDVDVELAAHGRDGLDSR